MSERGLSIDALRQLHRDFAERPQKDRPRRDHPAPTETPEDSEKPADDAPQGNLFGQEGIG